MPATVAPTRRFAGWGFASVELPDPGPVVDWLAPEILPGTPIPAAMPQAAGAAPGRALPPLSCTVSQDALDRLWHARGQSLPDLVRLRTGTPRLPDAVCRPRSADEIAPLLRACAAAGVRVVPWGGGTSVTGGVNCPPGEEPSIVLDLGELAGLEALDPVSRLATFGAGTVGPRVEHELARHGLTLGHFPQSWELSTVGGWVVTRSAGQESLGSGRIEDLVAGVDVVAPSGELLLAALPASAAGPDLRQLVLGSEGRFGVVTRATLRVRERPAVLRVRAFLVRDWDTGMEVARSLVHERIPLSLLRLSDVPETEVGMAVGLQARRGAALVRAYLALRGVRHGCLLLLGAAGDEDRVGEAEDRSDTILRRHRAVSLGGHPGRRWLHDRFRHPYLRDALLDRGIATDTLETAAPWSRLGAVREQLTRAITAALEPDGEHVAVLCHLSHPYPDGASLYFTFFFACAEPDATVARWATIKRAANSALVRSGATLSHHHGIGQWHAPAFPAEVGAAGVDVLRAAAAALDPTGVLNPHVLLDPIDRLEG